MQSLWILRLRKLIIIGAIVAFGSHTLAATLSITSANLSVTGASASSRAGNTTIPIGDINGNGQTDLLVTEPLFNNNTGRIHLFLDRNTLGQNFLSTSGNITITTNTASPPPAFGKVVAGNGDLDGDGKADLAISVPASNLLRVFLGQSLSTMTGEVNATSADITFSSTNSIFNFGAEGPQNIAINGDVNGDGFDDILLGAATYDNGNTSNAGRSFLILGRSGIGSLGTVSLDSASSPNINVIFEGNIQDENAGYSVAILPDINGDGVDEVMIGAYSHAVGNPGHPVGVKAYLFYGDKALFSSKASNGIIALDKADAIFFSKAANDGFSENIQGLGDINGDGYGDFTISAPHADTVGKIYLYYGGPAYPYTSKSSTANHYAAVFIGSTNSAGLHGVARAGDINGDLLQDILIGEYQLNNNAGQAYITLGNATKKSGTINLSGSSTIIQGSTAQDSAGYAVGNAGDINQDGIDEFWVGAPGRPNQTFAGAAQLFSLAGNVTPNLSSGSPSITLYQDAQYSQSITTANNLDTLYIELTATDPESGTQNLVSITASSNANPHAITFQLREDSVNSGRFRGRFQVVRSRHDNTIGQVSAALNNTLSFKAKSDPSIQRTLSIQNAPPRISTVSITQIATGNSNAARIDYTLIDVDRQSVNFTTSSSQVQYLDPNDSQWKDASITGSTTAVTASELGTDHNTNFQPLIWEAHKDNISVAQYQIRIRPHDGTTFAEAYATSNTLFIDNAAPSAPILTQPPAKSSFEITVTGSAEPNSEVWLYVSDAANTLQNLVATTSVDGSGLFSAFPVPVSSTLNRISAVAVDNLGHISSTSNIITITFSDLQQTFQNLGVTASISIPLSAATTDAKISFAVVPTSSLSQTAPSFNQYILVFDLGFQGSGHTNLSGNASVTLSFSQALTTANFLSVYYLDTSTSSPNWSQAGITLGNTSTTQLSFQTSHFTRFAITSLLDQSPPAIGNFAFDGVTIEADSFVNATPTISFTIADTDSGIASYSVQVLNLASSSNVTQNTVLNVSANSLTVVLPLTTALADGRYSITATAYDKSIHSQTRTLTFRVASANFQFDILHAPNPFNPDRESLTFGYSLSQVATSLQIFIINLRGDLLWQYEAGTLERAIGYHRITWDGRDGFSKVPNGLYFAYCIAKRDGQTHKKKLKIAVLR